MLKNCQQVSLRRCWVDATQITLTNIAVMTQSSHQKALIARPRTYMRIKIVVVLSPYNMLIRTYEKSRRSSIVEMILWKPEPASRTMIHDGHSLSGLQCKYGCQLHVADCITLAETQSTRSTSSCTSPYDPGKVSRGSRVKHKSRSSIRPPNQ